MRPLRATAEARSGAGSTQPDRRRCICLSYTEGVAGKDPLETCTGFDWNDANTRKNWERHRVSPEEAEDVFFNEPLIVRSDPGHSRREKRWYALGQTRSDRRLFVSFILRGDRIRVISVRDMSRKEGEQYANFEKANS